MRPAEGRALVRGVNMVKRHQKQTRAAGGRHHLQGGADPPVQPGARRSQGRQADPRRLQVRRRRPRPQEGALRQAFGSRDRWLTRKTRPRARSPTRRERAPKPEKGDKGQQAQASEGREGREAGKGEAPEKAPAPKAKKPEERVTPRLQDPFRRGGAQAADRAVRLQEPHAGADDRQDRHQHGHRRGRRRPQEGRVGGRRSRR